MAALGLSLPLLAQAEPTSCEEVWTTFAAMGATDAWSRPLVDEVCTTTAPEHRACLTQALSTPTADCRDASEALLAWQRNALIQALHPLPHVADAWRSPSQALGMLGAQALAGTLLLVLVLVAQVLLLARQRAVARPLHLPHALGAAVIVATSAAWSWTQAPHGAWHSNQHGMDRLFALVDGVPARMVGISELHGVGWFLFFRPLTALLGDPFAVCLLLSSLASLGVFLLTRELLGHRAALVATAAHAWAPIHLRLAVTDDMYLPVEVALLGALLAAVAWVRRGDDALFALAAGWTTLAMLGRAEATALAPWTVVLLVLHLDGARLAGLVRRPWALAALAACVALYLPRFLSLVGQVSHLGQMARPAPDGIDALRLVPLAVAPVALAVLARTPRLAGPTRRLLPALDSLAMVGVAAVAAGLILVERLPTWGFTVGPYHALFDPRWSTLLLPAAALVGLGALALGGRAALASWLLLAGFPPIQLVALTHDCVSTYLRTAPGGLWPLAMLAGAAGARLLPVWGTTAAAAAFVGLGLVRTDVVTARFEKQDLWDLYVDARAALPEASVVGVLDPEDLPPEALAERRNTGRGHPWLWLGADGARVVVGLDRLDRWTTGDAPAYFLRTPSCYGMPVDTGALTAWRDDTRVPMRPTWRSSLSELATAWPADASPYLAYEAARCRAVGERYVLEPVFERTIRPRRSGSEYEQMYHPWPTLGLYRIVGPRETTPPPR